MEIVEILVQYETCVVGFIVLAIIIAIFVIPAFIISILEVYVFKRPWSEWLRKE